MLKWVLKQHSLPRNRITNLPSDSEINGYHQHNTFREGIKNTLREYLKIVSNAAKLLPP